MGSFMEDVTRGGWFHSTAIYILYPYPLKSLIKLNASEIPKVSLVRNAKGTPNANTQQHPYMPKEEMCVGCFTSTPKYLGGIGINNKNNNQTVICQAVLPSKNDYSVVPK